jgi:RNA polymerase sigma factor (sigma-70 family)
MRSASPQEVTQLLVDWSNGDQAALDRLMPLVDEELRRLAHHASVDPQQSRVVELRFFGGLTVEQTAEVLGLSPATIKREWSTAKAWLYHELSKR